MNKVDRGMIKWQPFNSVISNKMVLNSIIKEKRKIAKPTMSEEELLNIENKIMESYYLKNTINIAYYKNGFILNTQGQIKKIDKINKLIYLNNLTLFWKQIIKITDE